MRKFWGMVAMGATLSTMAPAVVVTHSSLSTWLAATSGQTLVDFEGGSFSAGSDRYVAPTLTIGGASFTHGAYNYLFVSNPTGGALRPSLNGNSVLFTDTGASHQRTLFIDRTVKRSAFGLDLISFSGSSETFTIRASTGLAVLGTYTVTVTDRAFFGITSTDPLARLEVVNNSTHTLIDNFRTGDLAPAAEPVPEPATLALAGAGLAAAIRRRRARKG